MYTGALLLLVGLTVLTVWLASTVMFRLEPGADQKELLARLGQWAAKGLVLPAAVWTLMNIGMPWLSWRLQPFAPRIQAAQKSGQPWFPIFLGVCIAGFFVVASFWCAVTVIWALGKSRQKMDLTARKEFRGLCLAAVLGLALPALFVLWAGGFAASGLALDLIAVPIAFYTPPLLSRPVRASYSRAIARMKMGKFDEAELEIIQQLETRADDYTGWMMMAELYAVHFRDLVEARKTILEVCGQPNITPSQYSVALHRLADWQLSIGKDPESARAALQMVCDHLPGTHLAKMAAARQQRLPLTAEDLRQQSTPHLIHRPALGDAFDELVSEEQSKADLHKAVEQANRCEIGRAHV